MKPYQSPCRTSVQGFSLIELLVVIAIMSVITLASMPTFQKISRAATLNSASQILADHFSLARQTALAKNCIIEVRIYQFRSASQTDSVYRALQIFQHRDREDDYQPLTKVIYFPNETKLVDDSRNTSLLSIAGQPFSPTTTDPKIPGYGMNYKYLSFQFRPDGQTNLDPSENWFVTVAMENSPALNGGLPANFATVQIDPVSGSVRLYRP